MIESQAQAARDLVETLYRGGVRDAVISPGSRNTPLVLAAEALSGLRKTVVLDERSAAFLALGMSRCSARPTLLICTSGTAAAHYFPALLEADASRLPLIVLSAARPEELDHCGAQQSLTQQPLFDAYTRLSRQLPLADERGAPAWRSAAAAALGACWGSPEGPVHLNLPFREPLWQPDLATEPGSGAEFLPSLPLPDTQSLPNIVKRLTGKRGLIVCGPMHGCTPFDGRLAGGVRLLASALGWPAFCEPASRLRGKLGDHEIAFGDRLYGAGFSAFGSVEAVVQVGSSSTSKALRGWLHEHQGIHLLLDRDGLWRDPNHGADLLVAGDETTALECLAASVEAPLDAAWLSAWRSADQAAETTLDQAGWSEAQVLRLALEKTDTAQVASSLPIRHIEDTIGSSQCPEVLITNRGLNGIDGTISCAIGAALALQRGLVVVLGDLALQHDLGGLAQAAQSGADLAILVIDNGGGGIFRRLPIAQNTESFETYFETPQELDLAALAQGLGLASWQVSTTEELCDALPAWRGAKGTRLLIAQVDAESDQAWRVRVDEHLAAAIQGDV